MPGHVSPVERVLCAPSGTRHAVAALAGVTGGFWRQRPAVRVRRDSHVTSVPACVRRVGQRWQAMRASNGTRMWCHWRNLGCSASTGLALAAIAAERASAQASGGRASAAHQRDTNLSSTRGGVYRRGRVRGCHAWHWATQHTRQPPRLSSRCQRTRRAPRFRAGTPHCPVPQTRTTWCGRRGS